MTEGDVEEERLVSFCLPPALRFLFTSCLLLAALLLGLFDLVINALFLEEEAAEAELLLGLSMAEEETAAAVLFSEAKRLLRCIILGFVHSGLTDSDQKHCFLSVKNRLHE